MIGFRGEQVIGLVENPQLPTRWACRGARSRQGPVFFAKRPLKFSWPSASLIRSVTNLLSLWTVIVSELEQARPRAS